MMRAGFIDEQISDALGENDSDEVRMRNTRILMHTN